MTGVQTCALPIFKVLHEAQKIRRRMPKMAELMELPRRKQSRQDMPLPFRDEDLAGRVDPSTGKKTPWVN